MKNTIISYRFVLCVTLALGSQASSQADISFTDGLIFIHNEPTHYYTQVSWEVLLPDSLYADGDGMAYAAVFQTDTLVSLTATAGSSDLEYWSSVFALQHFVVGEGGLDITLDYSAYGGIAFATLQLWKIDGPPPFDFFHYTLTDGDGEFIEYFHLVPGEYELLGQGGYNGSVHAEMSWAVATAPISGTNSVVPSAFSLEQNHPNPFNPETEIHFALPDAEHVALKVYNIMGQEVRTLVKSYYGAGYHTIMWNGKNEKGIVVPSGVYLYHLKAGDFSQVRKMILLR